MGHQEVNYHIINNERDEHTLLTNAKSINKFPKDDSSLVSRSMTESFNSEIRNGYKRDSNHFSSFKFYILIGN